MSCRQLFRATNCPREAVQYEVCPDAPRLTGNLRQCFQAKVSASSLRIPDANTGRALLPVHVHKQPFSFARQLDFSHRLVSQCIAETDLVVQAATLLFVIPPRPCQGMVERITSCGSSGADWQQCRRHLFCFFPPYFMGNSNESTATPKPVQVFRLRSLTASVFANRAKANGRNLTFHKVSLQKTYKDGEDFKTTNSLGRDDLPLASLLLDRAWQFILDAEASKPTESSDD